MTDDEAFDLMTEEVEAEKNACDHWITTGSNIKVKMCEKCLHVEGLIDETKENEK